VKKTCPLPRPADTDHANLSRWLRGNRRAIQGRMMTSVTRLLYNRDEHVGVALFPPICCCDMTGCIAVFQTIDPDVIQIQTFSGDKPDTIYTRDGDRWAAGFLKN
jgi:hypothetical protein